MCINLRSGIECFSYKCFIQVYVYISRRWQKQLKGDPITNTFLNSDRNANPTFTSFVNRVILICSNHLRTSIFHYSSKTLSHQLGSSEGRESESISIWVSELLRETTPPAECKMFGILKKVKNKAGTYGSNSRTCAQTPNQCRAWGVWS